MFAHIDGSDQVGEHCFVYIAFSLSLSGELGIRELASILLADLCGSCRYQRFKVSENAEECYSFLHDLICRLDDICPQFGVEKIKTIGATYMVASGIPEESESHADNIAMLAFAIAEEIQRYVFCSIGVDFCSAHFAFGSCHSCLIFFSGSAVHVGTTMRWSRR